MAMSQLNSTAAGCAYIGACKVDGHAATKRDVGALRIQYQPIRFLGADIDSVCRVGRVLGNGRYRLKPFHAVGLKPDNGGGTVFIICLAIAQAFE